MCFIIIVTLGFFEDIVIPPYKLQHPSRFDQMEQVWVWEYKTDDGETHDLFMDAGMSHNVRVRLGLRYNSNIVYKINILCFRRTYTI